MDLRIVSSLRWRQIGLWISIVCIHLVQGDKAQRIKEETKKAMELMEEYWQWRLKEAPEFASRSGIHKYDHMLEQYSDEAFQYRMSNATAMQAAIRSVDKSYLSHKDTISLDVMEDMLKTYKMGFPYRKRTAYLPLRSGLQSVLDSWCRLQGKTALDTAKGYENLIARYKATAVQADQMMNLTRQALALNNSEVNPSMDQNVTLTRDGMYSFMKKLVKPFENIPNTIVSSNQTRLNLLEQAKDAIAHFVIPAAERMFAFFKNEYKPSSQSEVGLSALPGGLDLYESCLRWHLSVNMTARQVHDLGLREVERIYKLMEKIKNRDNFSGDVRGYIAHLKESKENMYNSTEDMMSNIRELMEKIKVRLPEVLIRVPTVPMRLVERPSEMGPLGSYAHAPLDQSLPATYFANTYKPETSARFNMLPVVLHEAEPGHHLQAAYNQDLDLPFFRQATDFSKSYATPFNWPIYTAYVEGWGLYSEYLGEEFGFYQEPYGLLGRYSGEMLRACRLVVDTGIHAYGWNQQRAEDYIANYTALSAEMIHSEVRRYIAWPGQSCAYKIGEIKIKEMRKIAEDKLGDKFDIRDFHDRVLRLGPVPLHILEADITAWLNIQVSAVYSSASTPSLFLISPSLPHPTSVFISLSIMSILSSLVISWNAYLLPC